MIAAAVAGAAPFRRPSDRARLYRWHADALAAITTVRVDNLRELAQADPSALPLIEEGNPQCGWFKAIVRRFSAPVPSRIFMRSEVDDDGELVNDERLICEIGGEEFDVMEAWPKLCIRPISRSEYAYLMSVRTWAQQSAPDQPQAKTGRKIDWLTVQIPSIPAQPVPPPARKKKP